MVWNQPRRGVGAPVVADGVFGAIGASASAASGCSCRSTPSSTIPSRSISSSESVRPRRRRSSALARTLRTSRTSALARALLASRNSVLARKLAARESPGEGRGRPGGGLTPTPLPALGATLAPFLRIPPAGAAVAGLVAGLTPREAGVGALDVLMLSSSRAAGTERFEPFIFDCRPLEGLLEQLRK